MLRRAALRIVILAAAGVLCLALAEPAAALTRQQANEIALRVLKPQRAKGRVTVFGLPAALRADQTVVEASSDRLGNGPAQGLPKLGRKTWLFWEDLDVGALFRHPSVLLLVDDRTGRAVTKKKLGFYPLVDGKFPPFLTSEQSYYGPRYRIFSTLTRAPRLPAAAPEPAAPLRPLDLPPDAFKDDCLLAVVLVPAPKDSKRTLFANTSRHTLEGWMGLASSLGMSAYQATASGPDQNKTDLNTTDEQVDAETLGANVDKLVKDLNCKDVLLYMLGHGAEAPAPAEITVAQGKTITPQDLEKILKDHAADKPSPATFKILIEACYAERFKDALVDEPNLKIIAVSAKANQTTKSAMNKTQPPGTKRTVKNPGRPEFSHGLIEGIRKTIGGDEETKKLQEQGDSFLARVILAGFEKEKENDVAAQAGLTTPVEMHNLTTPAAKGTDCTGALLPFDSQESYFRFVCPTIESGGSLPGRPLLPWAPAGQATGFDVQLPGGRRVTLWLEPAGFSCSQKTRTAASDTLSCAGALSEGVAVQGNIRMSPGPAPGMGATLYVFVGGVEAGPFPMTGP